MWFFCVLFDKIKCCAIITNMKDMYTVNLIILILACWRLTSLFHAEIGPGNLFTRIRCKCGIIHDGEGYPIGYPQTFLGSLFECFWCLSVWSGMFIATSYSPNIRAKKH